jgi:hypothetical protein
MWRMYKSGKRCISSLVHVLYYMFIAAYRQCCPCMKKLKNLRSCPNLLLFFKTSVTSDVEIKWSIDKTNLTTTGRKDIVLLVAYCIGCMLENMFGEITIIEDIYRYFTVHNKVMYRSRTVQVPVDITFSPNTYIRFQQLSAKIGRNSVVYWYNTSPVR